MNILKFLSFTDVHEYGDTIIISGIDTKSIINDMVKIWGTSRITNNIFIKITSSKLHFYSFFLPDVVYVLQSLINNKKAYRVNKRSLIKIINLIKEKTWYKKTQEQTNSLLNLNKLNNFTVKPLSHQSTFFEVFSEKIQQYNLKGYLLAAAPGSGKTLTALMLSEILESDVYIGIVPSNSVNEVWVKTIKSRFTKEVKVWDSFSNKPLEPGYTHYIFHYESLVKAVMFFSTHKHLYKKPFINLDECHNFNDENSLRTTTFIKLCGLFDINCHVLWMSGTPVKAMGSEVVPLLMTIDPLFNDNVRNSFRQIFGVSTARGLDILANRIGFISYKIEKKSVVNNQVIVKKGHITMPNSKDYTLEKIKQDMVIFITERTKYYDKNKHIFEDQYFKCLEEYSKNIKTKQEKEDFELYKKYAKMLNEGLDPMYNSDITIYCNKFENKIIIPLLSRESVKIFKEAKSVYKYCHLKIQGEALGRVLGKKREQCNTDMVRNTNSFKVSYVENNKTIYEDEKISLEQIIDSSEKKTVIFTSYVSVVKEMNLYLKELGYNPLVVYADTNKDLQSIIRAFETNEDINPLIATFDSLSTAVPLIMANTGILMNSPFRAHEYDQTVSRMDRLDQDQIVRIYNMFLDTGDEPNLSTRSGDIIKWSREQVAAIMGIDEKDVAALESLDDNNISDIIQDISSKPRWLKW